MSIVGHTSDRRQGRFGSDSRLEVFRLFLAVHVGRSFDPLAAQSLVERALRARMSSSGR